MKVFFNITLKRFAFLIPIIVGLLSAFLIKSVIEGRNMITCFENNGWSGALIALITFVSASLIGIAVALPLAYYVRKEKKK